MIVEGKQKTKKKNYIRKKGLWLPYLILLELVKKSKDKKNLQTKQ